MTHSSICFVGFRSLAILAPEYGHLGAGGEEVQQALLARAFARRGYRTSMVVPDAGQTDGQTWQGVTTHKAYAARAGIPILRFIHPRWTGLWKALSRADADVYYTSTSGAHVGQVAHFAAHRRRKMIYRVAHDANCDPRKVMVRFWRDRKLYEYGLRRADAVLAQTEFQQRMLRDNYDLGSTIATMLVDHPDKLLPREERTTDVLWVNNLRRFKRPDRLAELAGLLPNLGFQMVGGAMSGFEDVHADLLRRAANLRNLDYLGPVPYHEVNALYSRATLFANTSETEGFPNSYLQAWARGTPVVAFFDPDGVIAREGLSIVPTSINDMRDALSYLHADHAAWKACSDRCIAYMARHYSDDVVLRPYLQTVDSLTQCGAKSS